MIYKNERKASFWMIFFAKFCLEMIACISFLIKGEKANAKAIWEGYKEFISNRNLSNDQIMKPNLDVAILSTGPVRFLILSTGILRKKKFQSL
jgi:hypothetical protein